MQKSHTLFQAGQHVSVRDEPWVVLNAEAFTHTHLVHVRGIGATNHGELRSLLSPFDRVEAVVPSTRMRAVSRQRAIATAAMHIADAGRWDQCWTAATAKIDLRAWQLEPALAAIKGAMRILLADRVGLGKTIQAALIVSELLARGLATRVLVLSPAPLREQWAHELQERFHLTPVVFDQASLSAAVASLPVGVNPWQTAPLIVSSIDLVKRPEVRSALDGVGFDVLVVDEAHHATPGTDRGLVVADLAVRTPWVVLVTATPHSGDEADFRFLQSLGSNGRDDLMTFKRSAPPAANRLSMPRSRMFTVTPTAAERALLEDVARYVHAVVHSRSRDDGARLVASVIARRAASSAQALGRTLARRIALLGQRAAPEIQPSLPWEDDDAADADVADALLSAAGLPNVDHEIEWLQRLLARAESAASHSSKVAAIRRLVRRTSESVLVFSEYRDVVTGIAAALTDLTTVTLLHGGLSPQERQHVVRAFNQRRVRVLVATDAAGEGLNLQHQCRLVVNVELPWMPRRLEQRIGRVDRIGQSRCVHALHLVHRQSFEATVIARLERRRSLVAARTRDAAITECATPAADDRRLRQAAVRLLPSPGSDTIYAIRRARHQPIVHIVVLYGALVLDDAGRLVQRVIVPLALEASSDFDRHLSRRLLRRVTTDPRLADLVATALAARCARAQTEVRQLAYALDRRVSACLESVARQTAGQRAWQGSLFDGGNDTRAERQRAELAAVRDRLEHRLGDATALLRLHASRPRLLAAWPAN